MGETRVIDKKTGGMKGQKAERYDLIPAIAMDCIARVFGVGAAKYTVYDEQGNVVELGDWNWLKGYAWSLSIGALKRHMAKFEAGKDVDDGDGGSGELHTASVAWHAIVLTTFQLLELGTDDRMHRVLEEQRLRRAADAARKEERDV